MSSSCVALAVLATPVAAGATVDSDRAQITQLEQRIAAQGAHVQELVGRYNQVQAHLDTLHAQALGAQARLDADRRAESAAMATVRKAAIDAYVTGGDIGSPELMLFSDAGSVSALAEHNRYLGAVSSKWNAALTTVTLDQDQTEAAQQALQSEQAQERATLADLAHARDAATSAIASDEAMLTHVQGNLRVLLVAAARQRAAAQQAAERALATAPVAAPASPSAPVQSTTPAPAPAASPTTPASSPATPPPPSPAPSPSPAPGGYANPFRGAAALSAERIDQGVDYSGFGPIYAIGNGVVLTTVGGGWPGGTFIAYQLTDGPARGLVVYAAEDIASSVQPGQSVTSNTVLGQMYAGPDGIETGWADGSRLPDTMARSSGQFDGGNSTAFGANFSQLLSSLGAPPGILVTNPPSGTLPPSWPRW